MVIVVAPTIDPEFLELMPDTVLIEPVVQGPDLYGQSTYGEAREVRCRIEGKMRKVTTASGQESVSSVQVFLSTFMGVNPSDRITLPARYERRSPDIMAVSIESDENGPYYEEIFA